MTCTDSCRRPSRGQAHCGAEGCHKTFTAVAWFDLHRIGGRCNIITDLVDKDGVWATPERHQQSVEMAKRLRAIHQNVEQVEPNSLL